MKDREPTLTAAVTSIVVSVVVFWTLLVARGTSFAGVDPLKLAPFAVAGLANPAAFRLLYFRSIDRIGARVSSAIVSANPAVATVLALPLLGEPFTVLTGVGLLCIMAGGVLLQLSGTDADETTDIITAELGQMTARDLVLPITAMALLGCSFVLVKVGLNAYSKPLVATAVGQTAALVAFVGLFGVSSDSRRRVRISDRTALVAFVFAGVFVTGNWLAWFSALQIGTVVTVVPLSNVYPLVIVALSYGLARQFPKSPRVLTGITAIIAGATLMQLS
ncbi:DMT family transporter [Haloarcula mannanilytica]|uniref:DMT family transporter n=1 Tax=Haloarcula mannanilytica TaxID=2509225 RepID=UPI0022864D29|nr:DMT family transporter [Haloarcula mannanilytica]